MLWYYCQVHILHTGLSLVGWKVVMIIGIHGWSPPPQRFQLSGQCQPKKSLRTVDGPLLHVVSKACQLLIYQLQMFLTLANLNIQNNLKHWSRVLHLCAVFGALTKSRARQCTNTKPSPLFAYSCESVGYVLSECKQLRKNSDVYHYIRYTVF